MGGQPECIRRTDVAQRPCAYVSFGNLRELSECGMRDRARLAPSRVRETLSQNFLYGLFPVYWRRTF